MARSFVLGLLGRVTIVSDGEQVSLRLGKKAIALIGYLASPLGPRHSRDKLAALLWPDRFSEQARHSLRQALSDLRKQFGEALLTDESGVAFCDTLVSSELARFEQLSASGERSDLAAAASLVRGHFLANLDGVSPEFDDWLALERRRWRDKGIDAFDQLARLDLEAGDFTAAIEHAGQVVAMDPVHEGGHRTLMTALALSGRRSAALRQFEVCRQALGEQIDVEPSIETSAAYEAIRQDETGVQQSVGYPYAGPTTKATLTDSAPTAPSIHARRPAIGKVLRRLRLWRHMTATITALALMVTASLALMVLAGITFLRLSDTGTKSATLAPAAPSPSQARQVTCLNGPAIHQRDRPQLLILPFRQETETESERDFSTAAAMSMRQIFSHIGGLTLSDIPDTTEQKLSLSRREIAAEQGASYFIDGSISSTKSGGINATVWMINVSSGAQVAGSLFNDVFPSSQLIEAPDQLALRVASSIQRLLTDGNRAVNYPVYDAQYRDVFVHNATGYDLLNKVTPATNDLARSEYLKALELAPQDADAVNGLAWTYLNPVLLGWSATPQDDLEQASALARKSIGLNSKSGRPYSVIALAALATGDHKNAVQQAQKALEINENGADEMAFLAYILSYTGETQLSLSLAERSMRLRPNSAPIWSWWMLGRSLRLAGEPERAIACLDSEGIETVPLLAQRVELALALEEAGNLDRARLLAAEVRLTAPDFSAQIYCTRPRFLRERDEVACINSLSRVGFSDAHG